MREIARGPVSRVLSCGWFPPSFLWVDPIRKGSHSSRPYVATRLKQPTRAVDAKRICLKPRLLARRPYLALLQVGFTMPFPLPVTRCALTAPFHPYRTSSAVCSLWHYPLTSPSCDIEARRALPATLVSWSPDFPRYPKITRLPGPLAEAL